MKLTDLHLLCLSRMHAPERQWFTATYRTVKADCAVVVIETDEGVQGIGEAAAYGVPHLIAEWVDWLKPALIGHDPTDRGIDLHPNGPRNSYDTAVAGIDCALWDLRGKVAGKRVSELLTDNPLEKVRVYASSGCRYDWRDNPHQLIEETLGYLADGFTACKVRLGSNWAWDGITTDHFIGLATELAQEVNGRMELMVDGNQRLTVEQAMKIAVALEKLGFVWFEEPIKQDDIDGYVKLNHAVDMPITGGEQFTTLERFRPYLERRAYDIVQPDAGVCGLTECYRIAEFAHRYGIDFAPHSWHNGLMAMANGHLVAALPKPRVLEICMIQGPLQWGILAEKPAIVDGYLQLPAKAGLGVELTDEIAEKFPYIEGHYGVVVQR
jgi:L-alanine-DL-glutamate epimerase-like enolase superfamily enzyme